LKIKESAKPEKKDGGDGEGKPGEQGDEMAIKRRPGWTMPNKRMIRVRVRKVERKEIR